jgi:hypothetical protein
MKTSKPTKSKTQVFKAKGGTLSTLHKGFLDLRALGPVQMRRSSEISLDEETQKYYITFLEPELASENPRFRDIFFDTYELAVEREIIEINQARLNGVL